MPSTAPRIASAELLGHDPVTVEGDHEIYLADPTVLTGIVGVVGAP